ncbi:MAG: cupin domain-containing protein [Phycisphaeraceae bacterium]
MADEQAQSTTSDAKMAPPLQEAVIRRVSELPEWRSVCGQRRDMLATGESPYASLHYMRIGGSVRHYHKQTTEFYFVAHGKGHMELDGEWSEIQAGDLIVVPPNTWHTSKPADDSELHVLIIAAPPEAMAHGDCYFE